jgi:hypothetical protein
MARGKYKASAQKRTEFETIEQLTRKVQELTEENENLKKQSEKDHQHHAFQIAQMFENMQESTSPKVQALEETIETLREELVKVKRALRGM